MGCNSLVLSSITLVIYKLDWTKCLKLHCRNGLTLGEGWIRSPDKSFSSLIDPILLHSGFANLQIWADRMVRQIVLSRAYFSKYFYVGSQSTLQMLIKPPNLVGSLPCATYPHYFALCSMHSTAGWPSLKGSGFGTDGHLPAHLALSNFCRSVALLFQICLAWLVGVGEDETMLP